MNKIEIGMRSDLASLREFVLSALAYGREQMDRIDPDRAFEVEVGDTSFAFAESSQCLGPSIKKCLWAKPSKDIRSAKFSVYADYTSWHLNNGYHTPHANFADMNALNAALGEIGVNATYTAPENRWDIFDPHTGFGVRLQCGLDGSPPWEDSAPLVHFCSWIARQDGKSMVHAASIAREGVGILLIGNGGAGKSGTTLGAMLSGLQSAGDDYSLISGGTPYFAHAIHRTVKQDLDGLRRLGLPTKFELNWQNKAVFQPETVVEGAIVPRVEIKALVMPKIGAPRTTFENIAGTEVFKALAISTLKQIGTNRTDVFKACADITRHLPCYRMQLGADNKEIVAAVSDFLETL